MEKQLKPVFNLELHLQYYIQINKTIQAKMVLKPESAIIF